MPDDAPTPSIVVGGRWAAWRRPKAISAVAAAALILIVVVACVRVARTWSVFSATADEPQHVAAGIAWLNGTSIGLHEPWRTINPPLARIAVGLGPYLAGTQVTPFLRDMLYTGPGYLRNLELARPGTLPFLALAIVLTWLLARRAYGGPAAWIAAAALSCVPAFLGHAGLATTDVAFTALYLLALLALLAWLEEPTLRGAALFGLALGLAGATKLTALTLPVTAVAWALARRSLGPRPGTTRRLLAQAPLVAAIALLLVWASYRFEVAAPASLWQPVWMNDTVSACFPSERGRRFAGWLLGRRLPAPTAFLGALALCAQEAPGRTTAYLMGRLTQDGFPAFFPIALAVKIPLPVSALAVIGFVAVVRGKDHPAGRFRALAPLLAGFIYLAAVMPSRTNIGVRHVLPLFPFIAMLAGRGVVALWRAARWQRGARVAAGAALAWTFAIPFAAAPDYFPWFNALAGRHPERVIIDSDVDWGQDLFRLEQELARRNVDRISIAYFGASEICKHKLPRPTWLMPRQPVQGWIAISESFRAGLDGSYYRNGDPCDRTQLVGVFRPDARQYAWLDAYQPVARVGASILLYHVP